MTAVQMDGLKPEPIDPPEPPWNEGESHRPETEGVLGSLNWTRNDTTHGGAGAIPVRDVPASLAGREG
jgi:hypothetical protein